MKTINITTILQAADGTETTEVGLGYVIESTEDLDALFDEAERRAVERQVEEDAECPGHEPVLGMDGVIRCSECNGYMGKTQEEFEEACAPVEDRVLVGRPFNGAGPEVCYTGGAGDAWVSPERGAAWHMSLEEAQRKLELYNRRTAFHGLVFRVEQALRWR